MRENRPSATAQRVAMRRAAHQILDHPKVLEDPIALRIIGAESASALQADPQHLERTPLERYLRAFMAVRSRYAEDELARAIIERVLASMSFSARASTRSPTATLMPKACCASSRWTIR
jgi:O-methyltransferase involved in polyketide biosynthesis